MAIAVIYEDEWLLVVDKPPGLLVIPTPKNEKRTLTSILNEDLKKREISYRLHPAHRLDRETSGLIIYAKGKSTQEKMMRLFKARGIKKTYLACVRGCLLKDSGRITNPIEGASAVTEYRVLARKKDFTAVQINLLTGRTNQIRIHFKQIGHPILGETKYAFRRDFKVKAKRLCLHAQGLDFIHPVTKKPISLRAGHPAGLREFFQAA